MSSVGGVGGPRDAGNAIATADSNAADFGGRLDSGAGGGSDDMKYYLDLQRAMLKEQQVYQALSQVMKGRADNAMSAIRNFK